MFDDPTLIGPWPSLATRLQDEGVLAHWSADVPELAAADGGCDDDALLLLLHLLSGVVWRLVSQQADLSPDVTSIVLGELTCQIRSYRWRARPCGLVTSLELDTRRAVLGELRPSDRYHPERVEQLTADGVVRLADRLSLAHPDDDEEDLDVVDLLLWAAGCGVDVGDLRLLVASERARGRRGDRADARVAAARGISRRHLLRRRKRALAALRAVAPAYLQAVS